MFNLDKDLYVCLSYVHPDGSSRQSMAETNIFDRLMNFMVYVNNISNDNAYLLICGELQLVPISLLMIQTAMFMYFPTNIRLILTFLSVSLKIHYAQIPVVYCFLSYVDKLECAFSMAGQEMMHTSANTRKFLQMVGA